MNRRLAGFCIPLVSAALAAPAPAQQVEATFDLLTPAEWPAAQVGAEADALPVLVDRPLLDGLVANHPIRLALSADTTVDGVVSRIERRSATRYSVFGRFDDDPDGFFILAVEEDVAVGVFQLPGRTKAFRLNYVADGVHLIAPVDAASFGECETTGARAPRQPAAIVPGGPAPFVDPPLSASVDDTQEEGGFSPIAPRGGCSAPPRHFDAMIYYTPAARFEAGGANAMNAECQLAVDTANVTYANSGIPARMVLVFRGQIPYAETGNFTTDRDRLQNPGDGFMDGVHATRNTYGGDFVSLFVSAANYSSACGLAYCLPADASWGFCIVNRGCASNNFTFAHEIGHLQGCAHNRENAGGSGCSFYCDSYGHRFAGNTGSWRTVMSQNNGAGTLTRIGWFSNPLVNFDGVPTGVSGNCSVSTNNAGTIVGTTASREDWRDPRFEVWVDFGQILPLPPWDGTYQQPWSTVASGVNAVYGGAAAPLVQPRLIIKAGVSLETLTITKPMLIQACGGTVRIGG